MSLINHLYKNVSLKHGGKKSFGTFYMCELFRSLCRINIHFALTQYLCWLVEAKLYLMTFR